MEIEVSSLSALKILLSSSVKEGKGVCEKEFEKERRFRPPSVAASPKQLEVLALGGPYHLKTFPVPLA